MRKSQSDDPCDPWVETERDDDGHEGKTHSHKNLCLHGDGVPLFFILGAYIYLFNYSMIH